MKKRVFDTRYTVTLAMLAGLLAVMQMTGIGFIPLPTIKITTMHIPVILGAVLLGPTAGAVLGAVFGLCSVWANTTTPGLISFAFSPFLASNLPGVWKALWIGVGCRILFGWATGMLWKLLKSWKLKEVVALPITGALMTIFHTLLVMGSIWLLLAQEYAVAQNMAVTAVFGTVMAIVAGNGIPEAIAAGILVTVLGKALLSFMAHTEKRRK